MSILAQAFKLSVKLAQPREPGILDKAKDAWDETGAAFDLLFLLDPQPEKESCTDT